MVEVGSKLVWAWFRKLNGFRGGLTLVQRVERGGKVF